MGRQQSCSLVRAGSVDGNCPSGAVLIKGTASIRLLASSGRGYSLSAELNKKPEGKGSLGDAVWRVSLPGHGAWQRSEGNGIDDQMENKEHAHFII